MRSKLAEICISAPKGVSSKRTEQKGSKHWRAKNDGHLIVGWSINCHRYKILRQRAGLKAARKAGECGRKLQRKKGSSELRDMLRGVGDLETANCM